MSAIVYVLRQVQPGLVTESQVREWIDSLMDAHRNWHERPIVRKAEDAERVSELLQQFYLDGSNVFVGPSESPEAHPLLDAHSSWSFLYYPLTYISDNFFASRLDTWRAILLYIGLIQHPMWGVHDGGRFVCAVDLCRTHAALGVERNFLGAEEASGLYLAGVTFGGPDMHEVQSSTEPTNL